MSILVISGRCYRAMVHGSQIGIGASALFTVPAAKIESANIAITMSFFTLVISFPATLRW
jgi:hypothetical protein